MEIKKQNIIPTKGNSLLRTIIREDVYEDLTNYAKSLKTGLGDWDYGIAIERLLEFKDWNLKQIELECRIEELELALMNKENYKNTEQVSENKIYGLIGKNKTVRIDEN